MVKIRQDLSLKETSENSKETLQININISTSFRLKFKRGMNEGFRASFGSII